MLIEPLAAFFAMLVGWAVIIALVLRQTPGSPVRRRTMSGSKGDDPQ